MINKNYLSNVLLIILCQFIFLACSSTQDEVEKYRSSAQKYIDAGQYKEAIIELQNVVRLDPQDDAAYLALGETYAKLQNPEKAARAFFQAVEVNPENIEANIRMGQMYLLGKALKKARESAEKILKDHPENIKAMHLLASVQINERNIPLSIKTLEKAIAIAPAEPKSHLLLGHILVQMGKTKEAESHFLTCIELDDSLRAPYIELQQLYAHEGNWEKIEALLTKMVGTSGDTIQKRDDLARFYERHKSFAKAETVFKETVKLYPEQVEPLLALGSYYLRRQDRSNALNAYQRAEKIDNSDVNLMARMADLYFSDKDYEKSEKLVDEILEGQSDHVEANFIKGRLLFQRKDFSKALVHFERVIRVRSSHAMARFFKALCLLDSGKLDMPGQDLFRVAAGHDSNERWERELAMKELEQALNAEPGFMKARFLLADLYLRKKSSFPAKKHIRELLKRAPNSIETGSLLGRLLLLENKFSEAEKVYQSILKARPDYAAGQISLGLAYYSRRMKDKAMESFQKALEINPKQLDALNYVVTMYMEEKDSAKALEAIEVHLGKLPVDDAKNRALVHYLKGKVLMTVGGVDPAKAVFEKAIALNPSFDAPHEDLARIYEIKKDIDQALVHYETLNKMTPKYLPVYLDLSRVHHGLGNMKKAEDYLLKALEIKSDYAPAANNLAAIFSEQEKLLYKALQLAREARDKEPKNPDYLDTLGWVYYLQGSYDLALEQLQESVKLNPNNALTSYHLGWAYYETGQFESARKMMEKALALNPEFKGAEKARNFLGM